MKKIVLIMTLLLVTAGTYAQTAKSVLDKCASTISAKKGVTAHFTMESAQYGNNSGNISVKGRMFTASTPAATMWFDGKTLWTYMAKSNEVNVSTPTDAQLQALNPYNFINMYKQGFTYTMTTSASSYNVHLTATDAKRKVQELFITIDRNTYVPSEVKMRQGTKWTIFQVSQFKATSLSDSKFSFNAKDYPTAEVIDLR